LAVASAIAKNIALYGLNRQDKCDSVASMKRRRTHLKLPRESVTQSFALIALLLLGAVALAGPSGVLAWTENARLLDQRQAEVAKLEAERDRLRNRVNLLDPHHADPDLVGELLRADLNVVHPDELVIQRK
jgi:cell division protein FtsB